MKFNFKKVSAVVSSALMVGLTAGTAAAANYPSPFVSGGQADVAIVYGTGAGVSVLDAVEAGNIKSDLQSYMGSSSDDDTTSTTGEIVSLDTSSSRIWLNRSLDVAKSSLTDSDLPTVLADTSFSGNVSADLTQTIDIQAGAAGGAEGSNTVIFEKQPKSSDDPVMGISMGDSSSPLYNISITFDSTVGFSNTDSEGEELTLFGKTYTVSSDTTDSKLVLLESSNSVSLTKDVSGTDAGGESSASISVGEEEYTVELVSGSSSDSTIRLTRTSDGTTESKTISEDSSKTYFTDVEVSVTNSNLAGNVLSAEVSVGSDILTFQDQSSVTTGTSNDPVDGTKVFLVGGAHALTELAIEVSRPSSSEDAILAGEPFTDPVFGAFKVEFAGLSSPLDAAGRDTISVQNSGDDTMSITLADSDGESGTVDFAHNQSSQWFLGDDSNNTLNVQEYANLSEDDYIVLGSEDYGHILQVTEIYNSSTTSAGDDRISFTDVISGKTVRSRDPSTEGTATLDLDGKQYTITYAGPSGGSGSGGTMVIKYPTSDSASGEYVLYPTVKTTGGAMVALYEPLTIDLSSIDSAGTDVTTGFTIPDGDGYTDVTATYQGGTAATANWRIDGTDVNMTGEVAGETNYTTVTIGQLTYNFTNTGTANQTKVYVTDPEGTANIDNPGVIVTEGSDDNNEYHAFVIDLETAPGGDSNNGVGVNDVLFSSPTHWEKTMQSNTDLKKHVDWWGTQVTEDSGESDQKTVSVTYPSSQVYTKVYVGETGSTVSGSGTTATGSTSLGDVLVKDSEVSSVDDKNLIVVGGSCINSVAANLVGGSYCGAGWTENTDVGSGQFLIQSYGDAYTDGKVAMLVAGYEAADTVNAAKYLRTQTVSTDAGKKYVGTTSTSAELVTEESA